MPEAPLMLPGFMCRADVYPQYHGFDLWHKQTTPLLPAAPVVIGHSLGGNFALWHWGPGNQKLILVNPMLTLGSRWGLVWRWLRYTMTEGFGRKDIYGARNLPRALRLVHQILKQDLLTQLARIPTHDLLILRGTQDQYMCSERCARALRAAGYQVVEVAAAGHNWRPDFDKLIHNWLNSQL